MPSIPPSRCDLCDTEMIRGLTDWHFICPSCSLEKSSLTPQINAIDTLDEAQRATALQTLRQNNFATLLTWLQKECQHNLQRPTLLEVGCAHGWFMQQAQAQYAVQGIEPDRTIAHQASAQGLQVRHGFFPEVLHPHDRFDIIIFNDVLEHIPDTCTVLNHCYQHLNDGGYIVINAPNSKGIFYRISKWLTRIGKPASFQRMWQLGMPSPHLYYFNHITIRYFAEKSGFSIQNTLPLPSLVKEGLQERINYAGNVSKFKSLLMFYIIKTILPLIRRMQPDIHVWLLKKI